MSIFRRHPRPPAKFQEDGRAELERLVLECLKVSLVQQVTWARRATARNSRDNCYEWFMHPEWDLWCRRLADDMRIPGDVPAMSPAAYALFGYPVHAGPSYSAPELR